MRCIRSTSRPAAPRCCWMGAKPSRSVTCGAPPAAAIFVFSPMARKPSFAHGRSTERRWSRYRASRSTRPSACRRDPSAPSRVAMGWYESRIAALLLALSSWTACARDRTPARAVAGSAYPVELRDDRGRTVFVPAEPLRIVSLIPSHTETLVALGLGGSIVGIDDWSDPPPETASLPKLGGLYDT